MTIQKKIKFGHNKGNRRIWLENSTLAKYGFERGQPIAVSYYSESNTVTIVAANVADGHTVAGRERGGRKISIIDLNNRDVTALVGDALTGTVTYSHGVINIVVES